MKREWWYSFILAVAFVALGSYSVSKGGEPKELRGARGLLSLPLLGLDAAGETQPKLSGVRGTDEAVHWGRNPFLTPEEEATGGRPGTKGLDVKTIIVGEDKSVATLGRYTVSVGENIGEEKVVEIRRDAVVLERNGRRRILRAAELHRISVQIAGPENNNGVTKNNGVGEK
ncbi:MAG: hypothetical protein ACE10C_09945 [Candidatus Binatia bacterium]